MSMTRILGALLLATLVVPPVLATDPWVGKTRAEVEARLGEPDKVRDGSRLVYRFHRLAKGAMPGPRTVTVEVPPIGTLVRVVPRDPEPITIEPTAVDRDRALKPGGTRTGGRTSATYDPETRRFEPDWDPDDRVETAGKVKLTFDLDAAGTVSAWAVSPKRLLREHRP